MSHLKHEAAAKVKAYNHARSFDTELEALRNKNAILAKRNAMREQVIVELKVHAWAGPRVVPLARAVLCGSSPIVSGESWH